MVVLQHRQRQQLARQGRADDFLDGEALDAAYGHRVRGRGRRGLVSVVDVEYVGYKGWDNWWEAEEGPLEEDYREGEV